LEEELELLLVVAVVVEEERCHLKHKPSTLNPKH